MTVFKPFLLLYCTVFCILSNLNAQSKSDCNTIFVCIAKSDYDALFLNSFIKDTLFICKEETTKTASDEYTAKYFIGEFATLEFLQPSKINKFGDHLNDIGIEFKTRKIGFLDSLKKSNTKLEIDKIYFESVTYKYLWYDALKLKKNNTNLEFSVLEYSPAELKRLGFTDNEIKKSISPIEFNKIAYGGNKYPRKFKAIKSITLEVNQIGLNYLKQLASNFIFSFNKNSIHCNDFIIYYKFIKNQKITLIKNIEINLTDNLNQKTISISPKINLLIAGKTANIQFL